MEELTEFIDYMRTFNPASAAVRLVLTVLLSGAVGIERERHGKAAGLRTHILVCLGAAMAAMTGLYISQEYNTDISRIAAQVISGIGFLGAGTILVRSNSTITGLTTAASVWATGALGLAIGYGFYEAAFLCSVLMLFIEGKLGNIDRIISRRTHEIGVYAEFSDATKLNGTLEAIRESGMCIVSIDITPAKSPLPDGIGAKMTLRLPKSLSSHDALTALNGTDNVHFAVET